MIITSVNNNLVTTIIDIQDLYILEEVLSKAVLVEDPTSVTATVIRNYTLNVHRMRTALEKFKANEVAKTAFEELDAEKASKQ